MTFGLTEDGFRPKRLQDIKEGIETALIDRFTIVDVSAESVVGQLVGIFSKEHADLWEQLSNVYSAQHPSESSGIHLDYTAEYNGLTRLEALSSQVLIGCQGTKGTVISLGTQVRSTLTDDLFTCKSEGIITDEDLLKIYVTIETLVDSTWYIITINGTDVYQINSGVGSTKENIADALVYNINVDPTAVITALHLGNGYMMLTSKSTATFDTLVDSNMFYYTPIPFESIEREAIVVTPNILTEIETPLGGLDNVNNFEEGVKGRDQEEDAEFRIRRAQSLQAVGAGNLEAIVARIQDDIEGVTVVKGFENREDVPDLEGRPPHSIHIVVEGGDEQEIGDLLWLIKGGGIQTFGEVDVNVLDSNGDIQVMHFSRPVSVDIWVKADLTLYDEEIFPGDGEAQVKNKILEYGNTFTIGLDVMPDRFIGYIMQVPGIGQVSVSVKAAELDPWVSFPLSIGDNEIAVFALSRIEVTIP